MASYSKLNKLINNIGKDLDTIKDNTINNFVFAKTVLIREKLEDLRSHNYTEKSSVEYAVGYMSRADISRIKSVPGESIIVYRTADKVLEKVAQIPEVYFIPDDPEE